MNISLPKLDRTSALIALKTCVALVLSLAIALRLDWKPSFGAILIVVLQTPAAGATYKKGLLYIIGTLSGAIVGLTMVGLFAHDRVAFLVAAALVTGFGIYRLQGSRYAYAWLIFTITAMLVGFFSAQEASSAFGTAVMRSSTICLSVVIAFLVHGIFWPIRAGENFELQLQGILDGCRRLLPFASQALAGDTPDSDAERKAEADQTKAIAALRDTLDAATMDTERFRRFHAGYQQLVDQLHDLLVAILALRDGIRCGPDAEAGKSSAMALTAPDEIRSLLAAVDGEMEELMRDPARPRDGTAGPRAPDTGNDQPATIDSPFAAMLAGEVRYLAEQVSKMRASIAGVEDPEQAPAPLPAPPRQPFQFTGARFRKAAAASFVMLLLGWFFIRTQWPMGLMLSMVFATIAIGLGAMIPMIMIGRQLIRSLLIGAAIAAPLYLWIMPGIDRYEQLIPWLCVALFPLCYLIASPRSHNTIQFLFAAIFVIALLSLDEEGQSYSFSSFVNVWLGFVGGFGIALAVFALFSSVVPEREFRKQVHAFFAGCGQFMQKLAKNPPWSPTGAALGKATGKQWQGILRQLQLWSSMINFKRIAGNDRQATQALIESIERVALHVASAEQARHESADHAFEPLREPFQRLYETCADSFQLIASSLADLKPVPDLPDTESLIRDIESEGEALRQSSAGDDVSHAATVRAMSVAAHFRALSGAIHECRKRANALDWEAWDRNYF